jgi:hypothetical protein
VSVLQLYSVTMAPKAKQRYVQFKHREQDGKLIIQADPRQTRFDGVIGFLLYDNET